MKKMKKLGRMLLAMIPMLLAGFFCGILIGKYAVSAESQGIPGGTLGSMGILFAGFVLGMYLQIAVHEAGHLVFGLATGYKFCSYRLGSFMLLKEDGKLRLRRLKIAGTGGQCLMAPPPWSETLPVTLYNLGGCLMNLLCAALCLLLWLPLRDHWLGALPLVLALLGVGMALTNGIPMRVGGVDNDGRNALSLGKDPAALRAFWLQLKVSEAQARGLRLYQMPEDWFVWPETGLENPLIATQAAFACNRLMDQEHFRQAKDAMVGLLAARTGMLGLHRNLLTCDLIYCHLLEGDPSAAQALMTKEQTAFMKSMKTYPSILRTRYALAVLAEQDGKKAADIRAAFEKSARSYPYPAEIDSERDLLDRADRVAV